jgi:xylulokinase
MANREYNVIFSDDGGAELNSDEVIAKCLEAIKECSSQVQANSIVGMGISSQGEAFTAIGKNGETLCHAMISSDTRSEPYVSPWTEKFGKEKLYRITGHTPHPMFTVYKLLWLRENNPEVWQNTEKFLCFEDLLQYRLGLKPSIGYSLAGRTMMFDVHKHQWSSEILDSLNIAPGQLPKPMPSGTVVGHLDRKVCRALGLADNAFVVTGGHDQACSALGSGITEPGLAMYATGTVECITSIFDNPVVSDNLYKNNLCIYDHTVSEMYVTIAYNLTGGNILKWVRDEFGYKERVEAEKTGLDVYQLLLREMGERPSNLLVLPYFTPSGTPYFDTKTKGAILGLRLSTTRGEIIRGLLEGVAFEMRLNMEILKKSGCKINELRAVGGGAKSVIWTQLKADVLGKKITTLNVTEAGCLGVAMLACSTHTGKTIQKLAANWVIPVSTIIPKIENKKWYDRQFEQYRKLYGQIKGIYH